MSSEAAAFLMYFFTGESSNGFFTKDIHS